MQSGRHSWYALNVIESTSKKYAKGTPVRRVYIRLSDSEADFLHDRAVPYSHGKVSGIADLLRRIVRDWISTR